MSQLAEFYAVASPGLLRLEQARPSRRRLFRKAEPGDVAATFEAVARHLGGFEGSGYDYAVLEPYLDEQGVELAPSEYDDIQMAIAEAMEVGSILVMKSAQSQLDRVDAADVDTDRLRAYYEDFNEVDDPDAGMRMLAALRELRSRLAALGDDEALFILIR